MDTPEFSPLSDYLYVFMIKIKHRKVLLNIYEDIVTSIPSIYFCEYHVI